MDRQAPIRNKGVIRRAESTEGLREWVQIRKFGGIRGGALRSAFFFAG